VERNLRIEPLQYLSVERVAALARCGRQRVLRLATLGAITPAAFVDRGKTSVPLFVPDDAIIVASSPHSRRPKVPAGASMTDNATTT